MTVPELDSVARTDPQVKKPKALIGVVIAAVVFGIAATVLGVANAVAIGNEADEREEDRIGADLAGCTRGNELRSDVIAVAQAGENLTREAAAAILDELGADPDELERALRAMAPAMAEHRAVVDDIELVDCQAVTPGIPPGFPTSTTTTEEPNR